MSYDFTKLSNVPVVAEFPIGANAFIETNGKIKRCPSSGGGGVELITITKSGDTYTANKNSEEIIALIDSGKLPMLIAPSEVMTNYDIPATIYMLPMMQDGTAMDLAGFVFGSLLGAATVDSAGVVKIKIGF